MPIILRRLVIATIEAHGWVMTLAAAVHIGVTWLVLRLLGETALTGEAFGYYYLTTVTTVGYGDLSPEGTAARWFAGLWLMVGGIALFTTVLAKVLGTVSAAWRRRMEGYGDHGQLEGHTVLIGYEPGRTKRLIAELRADDGAAGGTDDAEMVVVSTSEAKLPEDVRLVRTERLADTDALKRAGLESADRIIIYADSDDVTLAACLASAAVNGEAHTVAYFKDGDTAALARHHCPHLETVTSPSEELVVRAARDPGASAVLMALVSATDEAGALYSTKGERVGAPTTAARVTDFLRDKGATLLALQDGGAPALCFGPEQDVAVDTVVFYVARSRVA
ncbi:potassium channel family protein [Parvularcula dongshanensis]|uniref:Voltage-gated potassium channel n=1 Tax=Parvularcula dongshanensis TaxID=1173995 RepID=A0A840I609_9PROT|nr:potassium channel family protein [Parvularcula dongshanensis]MBB4659755.1 voltage-gated potassium channel [Parvularcula dongshanensis]